MEEPGGAAGRERRGHEQRAPCRPAQAALSKIHLQGRGESPADLKSALC